MNCENSYSKFADLYDRLMSDVEYKERSDYICQLLNSCNIKPNGKSLFNPESHPIIADLGCGTGTITIDLAERGFEMIGIDISPEMLSQAMDKSIASGKRPLFLNQDMTCFELYGTVDAVLCSLDGINHVTDENTLMEMFKCVENYLNPGGCFIFDINTEYKLKNVIGNNIFYEVYDDVVYLWQNELN